MEKPGENLKKQKESDVELARLRTFQNDVKDTIEQGNISTAKIVMAEQAKKNKAVENQKNQNPNPKGIESKTNKDKSKKNSSRVSKKIIITLISILLFVGGATLIYFNIEYLKPFIENKIGPTANLTNNFLVVDKTVNIDSAGKTKNTIISEIQEIINNNQIGEEGDLIEINLNKTETVETEGGTSERTVEINTDDFFNLISAQVSNSLVRSLEDSFFLGLHKEDNLHPFIIFKSNNSNQTYEGMLNWENKLGIDIKNIFYQNLTKKEPVNLTANDTINSTSTTVLNSTSSTSTNSTSTSSTTTDDILKATSSPKTKTQPTFDLNKFVDLIILNKDARGIVNSDDDVLFFWSMINNDYLLMVDNKKTMGAVLNRINTSKLVR